MAERVLVSMLFGSALYGTKTPSSDTDIKSVHVPRPRDILLGRATKVIRMDTKEDKNAKNTADDVDHESMSLMQYLKLVAEGQTVALDMLFAPVDMLTKSSPEWREIRENRHRLVSRKCESFIGYCREQANKYGIKGSRVAAAELIVKTLNASMDFPGVGTGTRLSEVYGVIEGATHGVEFISWVDIVMKGQENAVRHLEVCNRKVPITATIKQAVDVFQKLVDTYGQRAHQAKSNEGVDWKALSHAVRVGRQSVDLLKNGEFVFPLSYADHLLQIKTGQLPYEQVAEEIEYLLGAVEKASAESTLQHEPDMRWIEDFVEFVYRGEIMYSRYA